MHTIIEEIKKERERLEKKFDDLFLDDVKSKSGDDLKNQISLLTKEIRNIKKAKDEDEEINKLKKQKKDLEDSYNDAAKEKASRIDYILLLLQERGDI